MSEGLSVSLPLTLDEIDGPYRINKKLSEVAEQNLKMIILTSQGERVMDPNFGVGIRSFLFEQESPFLEDEIKNRINNQVSKYAPFISIGEMTVDMDSDAQSLSLHLVYSVPSAGIVSELTIPVSA